jgi:hypothetical protein
MYGEFLNRNNSNLIEKIRVVTHSKLKPAEIFGFYPNPIKVHNTIVKVLLENISRTV